MVPFATLILANILLRDALVTGKVVNRTIDDTYGDPVTGIKPIYSPADEWNVGPGCATCGIQPDQTKLLNGTWHEATYDPGQPAQNATKTMSIAFNGTGIYIYVVAFNQVPSNENTDMLLNFTIDGVYAGPFQYLYNPDSTTVTYNYNIYANDVLPLGEHNFSLVTGWHQLTYIMFDYAIYTTVEDDQTSTATTSGTSTATGISTPPAASSPPAASTPPANTGGDDHAQKSNTGAIAAGGVVGGVVALALIVALVLCLRLRSRHRRDVLAKEDPPTAAITPYRDNPPPRSPGNELGGMAWEPLAYGAGASASTSGPGGSGLGATVGSGSVGAPTVTDPTGSQSAVAAQRQAALARRLDERLRAMGELERRTSVNPHSHLGTSNLGDGSSYTPSVVGGGTPSLSGSSAVDSRLREEISALRAQVAALQGMMRSQWAMGLTDQAPPEYEEEEDV